MRTVVALLALCTNCLKEDFFEVRPGTFCTSKMRLGLPLYAMHKVVYHAPVLILLFQVSHVCALLEDNPLRTRDAAMDRLGDGRGCLIVASAGDERGQPDLAQTIANVPLL